MPHSNSLEPKQLTPPPLANGKEILGLGLPPSPNNIDGGQEEGVLSPNSDPELITSEEVTIREPTTEESTSIGGVLRYCKHRILYPYIRLLAVMGLKPLGIPDPSDRFTCTVCLNKLYVTGVTVLLLVGYALQFLTCFRRDRGFLSIKSPPHVYAFVQSTRNHTLTEGNIIFAHLAPSLLHFSSFLYMVYLYRFHDDEQLPNLMERVFIQASHAHSSVFSQKKLLRTLQFMVIFSVTWVVLSTGCQLVQITTHSFEIYPWPELRGGVKNGLITLLGLSGLWQDAIQVTVIVSYCIHCRLLSAYFNLIHSRIQQHSITLPECIKEIGELDKLLGYLNNDLSPALGPLLILDFSFGVSSIIFISQKAMHLLVWDLVSLTIVGTLWVFIVALPLFEAAHLSTSCNRVRELGHLVRMRPFGYQNTPQADLDSFLLFVSTLPMKVHICKIPISASVIAITLGSTITVALVWGLIFV